MKDLGKKINEKNNIKYNSYNIKNYIYNNKNSKSARQSSIY